MGGPRGGGGKGHKGQSHQSILTQATVYFSLLYMPLHSTSEMEKNYRTHVIISALAF